MPLPVGTNDYRISSTFGDHHGLDFAVKSGTAAVSTVNGVVETARVITRDNSRSGSYGVYVVIRDEQGNRHYYAHLSGFNVQAGQQVRAGAVIGRTGNSGNSTGPHLHYEVRGADGAQIDPTGIIGDGNALVSNALGRPRDRAIVGPAPRRAQVQNLSRLPDLDPAGFAAAVDAELGVKPEEAGLLEDVKVQAELDALRLEDEARAIDGVGRRFQEDAYRGIILG